MIFQKELELTQLRLLLVPSATTRFIVLSLLFLEEMEIFIVYAVLILLRVLSSMLA